MAIQIEDFVAVVVLDSDLWVVVAVGMGSTVLEVLSFPPVDAQILTGRFVGIEK